MKFIRNLLVFLLLISAQSVENISAAGWFPQVRESHVLKRVLENSDYDDQFQFGLKRQKLEDHACVDDHAEDDAKESFDDQVADQLSPRRALDFFIAVTDDEDGGDHKELDQLELNFPALAVDDEVGELMNREDKETPLSTFLHTSVKAQQALMLLKTHVNSYVGWSTWSEYRQSEIVEEGHNAIVAIRELMSLNVALFHDDITRIIDNYPASLMESFMPLKAKIEVLDASYFQIAAIYRSIA